MSLHSLLNESVNLIRGTCDSLFLSEQTENLDQKTYKIFTIIQQQNLQITQRSFWYLPLPLLAFNLLEIQHPTLLQKDI